MLLTREINWCKGKNCIQWIFPFCRHKSKRRQTLEIVVLENHIIKDVIVEGGSLYTGDQIKSLLEIEAEKF